MHQLISKEGVARSAAAGPDSSGRSAAQAQSEPLGPNLGAPAQSSPTNPNRFPSARPTRLAYVIATHVPGGDPRPCELPGAGLGRGVYGACAGREPSRNMATCAEILRSEFPEIDGQVFDYVTGEPGRVGALRGWWWGPRGTSEGQAQPLARPPLVPRLRPRLGI